MAGRLKAILFDLDGVLVDSPDLHYEALNLALWQTVGFKLSRQEHEREFNGLPTRVKLAKLVQMNRLRPYKVDAVVAAKQGHTLRLIPLMVKPDAAKGLLLLTLLGLGFDLACVSNCTRANLNALLDAAAMTTPFAVTISNEDVEHPKPAPDPYLLAMQRLALSSDECIAVEDNQRGIDAAVSAGLRVKVLTYRTLTIQTLLEGVDGQVL